MSDRQEGIISHLVLILTSRLLQKDKKSSGKVIRVMTYCLIFMIQETSYLLS